MEWFIIIGILFLCAAPIFWVLPSAQQRQQAQLRQQAMQLGFQITLVRLPAPNPAPQERVDGAGRPLHPTIGCSRYALPWLRRPPDGSLWRAIRAFGKADPLMTDRRLPAGWLWYAAGHRQPPALNDDEAKAIAHCLDALPQDTPALEKTDRELAVFWQENGDADTLAALLATLTRLRHAR